MNNWRKHVNSGLKSHLEAQIRESTRHKKAYTRSKQPANAQLWVAIANLSKQILDLNLKMNYLERALRDIGGKKMEALKSAKADLVRQTSEAGFSERKESREAQEKTEKGTSGKKEMKRALSKF